MSKITLRKTVGLSKSNIDWFEKTYGNDASLSWVLDLLFSEFREAHVHTPQEYVEIAAKNLRRKIEDSVE